MEWARHSADWPLSRHSRFVACRPHRWHIHEHGRGPTILLIHGAGGGAQSWRHLFPLLTANYHTVAFDLPGQGFSRQGSWHRLGLAPMAQDIATLCAQEGWQPDALIGHSAGGALALEMARHMEHPPPVVGINAALGTFPGPAAFLFPLMAKALAATPIAARLFAATATQAGGIRRLLASTGSDLPPEDMRWYEALIGDADHVDGTLGMMARWHLEPLLRALASHPSPTLLITGARDTTVPPQTSARAAEKMPKAEQISLPNLGHLAHEENAEAVYETLQPFLTRQRAAASAH